MLTPISSNKVHSLQRAITGVSATQGANIVSATPGAAYRIGSVGYWINAIALAIAGGQNTGVIGYVTKGAMDADLAHAAGTVAYVTNDSAQANNGIYLKSDVSGAGAWTKSGLTIFDQQLNTRGVVTTDALPWGVADSAGNLALVLDIDNTLLAKLPLAISTTGTANGLSLTRGSDGRYVLSLGNSDGSLSLANTNFNTNNPESSAMFAVTDAAGNVAMSVDSTGQLLAKLNLALSSVGVSNGLSLVKGTDGIYRLSLGTAEGQITLPGSTLDSSTGPYSDAVFSLADTNGNVAFALMKDGKVNIPNLSMNTLKVDPTIRKESLLGQTNHVDINHLLVSGQSLSVAGSSATVVDYSDYVFSTGLHAIVGSTNTLAPISNTNTDGIMFSAVGQMKFLCAGSSSYTPDPNYNNDFKILVSGHGVSGSNITALSKGGTQVAYSQGMFQVDESARLAREGGLSVAVPAIGWIHGESDYSMTVATYQTKLIQLKNDYNTDLLPKTGQPNRIKLICGQNSGEQFFATPGVEYECHSAAATLSASEVDPEIILAGPAYHIWHRDGVHFDADGYRQWGQLFGKVYYKVVYRGESWTPLGPKSIHAHSPRVIVVKFKVPEPPLVLDTFLVTNPGNYGFQVRDVSGSVPITAVALVNGDTVRLTLGQDLGGSPELSYAWYSTGGDLGGPTTGPRGCLRDSDKTVGVYDSTALYNWCIHFKKPIL